MAVGDESIGYGMVCEVNDGALDAFVVIDKVEEVTPPSYTVGTVESKRLDLTNRVVIKLATLRTGDPLTIRVQHTNAGFARFVAIRDAYAEKQWRFTVPDDDGDTEITVPGILTAVKLSAVSPEAITTFELTVEVSGDEI